MATRRGPSERLTPRRSTGPSDRLEQFAESARDARSADDDALASRLDRLRGLGCSTGDMRLAYGWRAAVVTAALTALVVWLVTRVALTGLFVRFVTDDVVPVTGFNLGITLFATLTLGLVRARRFRLAVHHRLVPLRRGLRRRYGRWRRTSRQRRRRRIARGRYRCRQALVRVTRRLRIMLWRRRRRRARRTARWRRAVSRWWRRLRTRLRRRRARSSHPSRWRRRYDSAARRLRGWIRRSRSGRRSRRPHRAVLALLFGR